MAVGAIVAVLGVSALTHWEPSGETWGYWYFARVFAESAQFAIPDRGPLYTLYLNGFRWLGYPTSVIVEFLVTSTIAVAALVGLLRRYLGLGVAVFAALLWVPFLETSEPPVQKLALACSCWAVVARGAVESRTRFRLVLSYAVLGLGYMFRATHAIFIVVFATWDALRLLREGGVRALGPAMRPRWGDWPVGVVIVLSIWFALMQSPNPWNNAWFASTTYFPVDGKSLAAGSFLQAFNWKYIETRYGTFEGHDFYFTNQEAFGGARDIVGAIRANPRFVLEQVGRNGRDLITLVAGMTEVARLCSWCSHPGYFAALLLVLICYGAFRAAKDEAMALFVVGNVLLMGIPVLVNLPKQRLMFPFVPILILSAWWYATRAGGLVTAKAGGGRGGGRSKK